VHYLCAAHARWQDAHGSGIFRAMIRDAVSRLVRAWLVTAIVDAMFSSALAVFAYRSTLTRLWQGVASILLGPAAFEGERGRRSSGCCCTVLSR
jgi:hypothetical protein